MIKSRVFANIDESSYFVDLYGYRFYFSSLVYLEKFKKRIFEYIKDESIKLKNKYKVNFNNKEYLTLSLYRKIETRGFRIYLLENGEEHYKLKLNEVFSE